MTREALTALKRIDFADLIECVAAILYLPPPSYLLLLLPPLARSPVRSPDCVARDSIGRGAF